MFIVFILLLAYCYLNKDSTSLQNQANKTKPFIVQSICLLLRGPAYPSQTDILSHGS